MIPEMESCDPVLENHVMRWEAAKPIFAEVSYFLLRLIVIEISNYLRN